MTKNSYEKFEKSFLIESPPQMKAIRPSKNHSALRGDTIRISMSTSYTGIQSQSSFFHLLDGCGYTSAELAILYLKYKEGVIHPARRSGSSYQEKELDNTDALRRYLPKYTPKVSKPKGTDYSKTYAVIAKKYLDQKSTPTALSTYIDNVLNVEVGGVLRALRDRCLKAIPKLDVKEMNEMAMIWYLDGKASIKKAKLNPKIYTNLLIADFIYFGHDINVALNERLAYFEQKTYKFCRKLLIFKEYDLVYNIYKKMADKGYPQAMYLLHLLFSNCRQWAQQKLGPKGDPAFEELRWQVRYCNIKTEEADLITDKNYSFDYITTYENKYEELEAKSKELEAKNKELEAKNKELEAKVLDLTYRPGGPGFLKLQSRGVENGMKK